MQRTLHSLLLILAALAITAAPVVAQRTVTKDAGGGRKIVLHYNAADQITETDTLGASGELLEKDTLEYRTGAYVPQATSTSYWPNGKVHKLTQNTYDDNSNFTGEFIQIFDESGKQIGGHRLTHDPMNNFYTCADWNTDAHAYKPIRCPAGEESSGTPEAVKKFTQDEVMQQLARSRQAVQKPVSPAPAAEPSSAAGAPSNVREVGLIFPSHIRAGERVSGSVVENPADYEGLPGITVTRFALPFAASGKAATLAGWTVETSGEPPQPADGPLKLNVPPGQVELAVLFRAAGNGGAPVSKAIPVPHAGQGKPTTSFLAPATCIKGQLCVVRGPFNGNSSKTFAAFMDQPAKIVAETTTAAYLAVPDAIEPGPRPLVIAEGDKAVAFPMVISEVSLRPDRRNLPQGEQLLMYVTVEGPEEIPDPEWRPGNFPASNLDEARKLIPGYQVPRAKREDHEAREAEEKREHEAREKPAATPEHDEDEGGEILLMVKNTTPEVMNFRESKNGAYVFHLRAASFSQGEFKYKFVVDATKAGSFGVQSFMIPFLAPVAGQEFTIAADSSSAK